MPDKLRLIGKNAALIDQMMEIDPPETSVGGRGSNSSVELSGVAYGVKAAEFLIYHNRWIVEEIAQGQLRLNG